jgi:6-pyruvoyltetrahydropterin/6-carboxytetrahydropterin synthase
VYSVRVEIAFEAGHRLLGYPGKCAQPHGHSYRLEVVATTDELDRLGLSIDFGDLKSALKAWVDQHWDHAFLLNDRDEALMTALRSVPESKLYLFQDTNPSAEVLAREAYQQAWCRFGPAIRSVRVWESPTSYAEYAPGPPPEPATRQRNEEVFG